MSGDDSTFDIVPPDRRQQVLDALAEVIDVAEVRSVEPLAGGESGALVYLVTVGDERLLLRVEAARDLIRDPYRTYPVMRAAATAGLAPKLLVADPSTGVVLMAFIEQRPLTEHPGGSTAVAHQLGRAIATLQQRAPSGALVTDHGALLDGMFGMIDGGGGCTADVARRVRAELSRIRASGMFDNVSLVTAHNDLNPFNVMSDGTSLWLIDWEIAFPNDPMADIAAAANNLFDGTPHADVVLTAWLGAVGAPVTDAARARFAVMRDLSRLYYACLMLSVPGVADPPIDSFAAPTIDEFRATVESGHLRLGSSALVRTLGWMQLAGFMTATQREDLTDDLSNATCWALPPT